jgi:hypothetical protein
MRIWIQLITLMRMRILKVLNGLYGRLEFLMELGSPSCTPQKKIPVLLC